MMTTDDIASGMQLGPRRDAVSVTEAKITKALIVMDGHLEAGRYDDAYWKLQVINGYRRDRDELLTCHIHDIPGAVEYYLNADRQRKVEADLSDD
jgi:hypothetical protein